MPTTAKDPRLDYDPTDQSQGSKFEVGRRHMDIVTPKTTTPHQDYNDPLVGGIWALASPSPFDTAQNIIAGRVTLTLLPQTTVTQTATPAPLYQQQAVAARPVVMNPAQPMFPTYLRPHPAQQPLKFYKKCLRF